MNGPDITVLENQASAFACSSDGEVQYGPGQLAAEKDVQSLPFLKSKRGFRLTRYSRNPCGGIVRQTGGLAF